MIGRFGVSLVLPHRLYIEGAVSLHRPGAGTLRPRADDTAVAVVTVGETGDPEELSWAELRRQVAALAATMRRLGVGRGDVVAGYLPSIAETVTAFLATASVGAVWAR